MRTLTIKCDCCTKEIQGYEVYPLEHYVHVSPLFNRVYGHAKVVDGKMYPMSGRKEKLEFCLPCYNMLMEKFFDSIANYKFEFFNKVTT